MRNIEIELAKISFHNLEILIGPLKRKRLNSIRSRIVTCFSCFARFGPSKQVGNCNESAEISLKVHILKSRCKTEDSSQPRHVARPPAHLERRAVFAPQLRVDVCTAPELAAQHQACWALSGCFLKRYLLQGLASEIQPRTVRSAKCA